MKIKIFSNDKSEKITKKITSKLIKNGFEIVEVNYEIAIAIGGDGTFLKMVRETNFDENIYYVGINSGTLGFMTDIGLEAIDNFILKLKEKNYYLDKLDLQEITINNELKFLSLNEIIVRVNNLRTFKADVRINDYLLEQFAGDGLLIATTTGSTAHNLSLGGSVVYNALSSLQITPIGPINSKVYKSLNNSVIVSSNDLIELIIDKKDLIITIDGINYFYNQVNKISSQISNKRITCLRINECNFTEKIKEKLLGC